MPVTAGQKRRAEDQFNRKPTNSRCPSCGTDNWASGHITSAPFEMGGAVVIPAPGLSQLPGNLLAARLIHPLSRRVSGGQ